MLPKKYRGIRAGRRIRQDTSFEAIGNWSPMYCDPFSVVESVGLKAIGENFASLAVEPVADFN